MDLKNGYKVIYDLAKDGKRNFYASKTGAFADAEPVFENVEIGNYKLIYEKDGMFYGSITGIPAADDRCFTELNKVFVEGYEETTAKEEPAAANAVEPEDDEVTVDPEELTTGENELEPAEEE